MGKSLGKTLATKPTTRSIPAIGGPAPGPMPPWKSPPEVIQTAVEKWWNSLSHEEQLEFTAEPEEAELVEAVAERTPSAFMKFTAAKRDGIVAMNPGLSATEVSKVIGELWGKLSPEEKATYTDIKPVPLSAYMRFSVDARPKIIAANPGVTATDIMKKLAEAWKELPLAEKKSKYGFVGGKRRRKTHRRRTPKKSAKKHVVRRRRTTRKH